MTAVTSQNESINQLEKCVAEQTAEVWKVVNKCLGTSRIRYTSLVTEDIVSANAHSFISGPSVRRFHSKMFKVSTSRRIGHGAISDVFIIQHHDLKEVALKKYLRNTDWERFKNEMSQLINLRHKRIVPILGAFFEGSCFLVLQACQDSICGYIREFTPRDRLRACLQTLEAVSFIHARDVIHCDIKPNNILLTTTGNFVLADFDVAISLKGQEFVQRVFVGTTRYWSANICSDGRFSKSSDLWAAGCTLFEILMKKPLVTTPKCWPHNAQTVLGVINDTVPVGDENVYLQAWIKTCAYEEALRSVLYNETNDAFSFSKNQFVISTMQQLSINDSNVDTPFQAFLPKNRFDARLSKTMPVFVTPSAYLPAEIPLSKLYYDSDLASE